MPSPAPESERLSAPALSRRRPPPSPKTFWVETLGCPKNAVDSDKVTASLLADGLEPAASPEAAELVVVNTCAFVEAAREESIAVTLALADQRKAGARLVVTGCMAERYGDELAAELPEVDAVVGFAGEGDLARISGAGGARQGASGRGRGIPVRSERRHRGGR